MCRVRKNIMIAQTVIKEADQLCDKIELTRSNYIEMLIRADLKKRNLIQEKPIIRSGNGWQNNKWMGKVEDMPI